MCIESGAGTVVPNIQQATHAVLRHQQQLAFAQAQELGTVSVVPVDWVLLSANKGQLQLQVCCLDLTPGQGTTSPNRPKLLLDFLPLLFHTSYTVSQTAVT